MEIVTHHRSTSASLVLSGMILVTPACAGEKAAPAETGRRPYVAGIVGSSLGGNAGPNGEGWIGDLATPTVGGDAAIGVAVDRSQSLAKGAARLEFEGRTRSRSSGTGGGQSESSATDWSTMVNVWRDIPITDHLGVYAGGGAGAGGVRGAAGESRSEVTWQVGGGATYALNERVTLDVGYRALPAAFDAGRSHDAPTGEVLFSVRLYEPFRGWLRD